MKASRKPIRRGPQIQPDFVVKAGRALRRAVGKVREENEKLGLPLIGWQNGKVAELPATD